MGQCHGTVAGQAPGRALEDGIGTLGFAGAGPGLGQWQLDPQRVRVFLQQGLQGQGDVTRIAAGLQPGQGDAVLLRRIQTLGLALGQRFIDLFSLGR